MPFKVKHPCRAPGCAELTAERFCLKHKKASQQEYNATRDPGIKRLYNSDAWKRLRMQHLRENPLCVACKAQGIRTPATEIDHIQPHAGDAASFYRADNLQSLCVSCHSRKTAASGSFRR